MFDKRHTADCRIYNMLAAAPGHLSFHTPGTKAKKWDITELSFSDNLSNPTGVLKAAQEDIARILGADSAFILTDGSTSGVLSMLYASGVKKLLMPACSHKSVYNGCKLLGVEKVVLQNEYCGGVPQQPSAEEIEKVLLQSGADGVILASPDYYGNVADLKSIKAVCLRHGAILLCDGAHGGHLHGTSSYAGNYCDAWVDGVHKSLPAFTQGAVVCAKGGISARLADGVDVFRTTSPNYIIMASVEYAVKYPFNEKIQTAAEALKTETGAYANADWTKIVIRYGANAYKANAYLESKKVYPEFCDGENIMFYLSPASKQRHIKRLKKLLRYLQPLQQKIENKTTTPVFYGKTETDKKTLIPLEKSVGRICGENAGLFPPCIPVVSAGQKIEKEHVEKLKRAVHTYGLIENKITVYEYERKTD